MLGQRVATLVDEYQQAGPKSIRWNGKDERGASVSGGVYFYRLEVGGFNDTQKLVVVE